MICANRAEADPSKVSCADALKTTKCACRLEVEALEKGQETRVARVPDSAKEVS